ncbi:MAG: alpha/beta hydrolase [Rhizobiaceae bacterium]
MTTQYATLQPKQINLADALIMQSPVEASMVDGAKLRGYIYRRMDGPKPKRKNAPMMTTPLLCLATELGNGRQHHRFALAMACQPQSAQKIITLDMRGRGRSDFEGIAGSSVASDADDLISFCDAHNLHHIDLVVSGYSVFAVFAAMTKRPGLVQRLVLNDAAPEFDAVGIARRTVQMQRATNPTTWDECIEHLKLLKGEDFPAFSDDDWLDMARQGWRDEEGQPVKDVAKGLKRWSNLVDYDNEQPSLWPEFALFKHRPVMLVQGEHSSLVTGAIVDKTAKHHPELAIVQAKGQGHVPQLERGQLTLQVMTFLLR